MLCNWRAQRGCRKRIAPHVSARDHAARRSAGTVASRAFSAIRSHAAENAPPTSRAIRRPAPRDHWQRVDDLYGHDGRGGGLCRCIGGRRHQAGRPRRHHVRESAGTAADDPRLRLARRHRRSDQHRLARRAARAHSGQLRRAADGDRARTDARAGGFDPRQDRFADALAGRRRTGAGGEPVAVRAVPAAGTEHAAASARSGRYARHPLHLGHDRPLQGRVLSARAIFLVGGHYRRTVGRARRRRPDDDAAAVPHQRAQQLLPGDAQRRDARRRAALFRLQIHGGAGAAPGDRHLCARRHGADFVGATAKPGRPRPQGAPGIGACGAGAFPPAIHRPLRLRADRRLRIDRDQLHHGGAARRAAARADGPAACPASPPAWSTRTTTNSPTARPAN